MGGFSVHPVPPLAVLWTGECVTLYVQTHGHVPHLHRSYQETVVPSQSVTGFVSPLEFPFSYSGTLEEYKAWPPQPFAGGVASGFTFSKDLPSLRKPAWRSESTQVGSGSPSASTRWQQTGSLLSGSSHSGLEGARQVLERMARRRALQVTGHMLGRLDQREDPSRCESTTAWWSV